MEESNQKVRKSPVRRTRKQIVKLLKDFESKEGMTIVDFCKLHEVNKSNFYNWQKRYGSVQSGTNKSEGFVPLQITPALPTAASGPLLFAEVNGIRLYQVVAAEYLKALLS
jgi:hypothetical protein